MKIDFTFILWLLMFVISAVTVILINGSINPYMLITMAIVYVGWAIYSKIGAKK